MLETENHCAKKIYLGTKKVFYTILLQNTILKSWLVILNQRNPPRAFRCIKKNNEHIKTFDIHILFVFSKRLDA